MEDLPVMSYNDDTEVDGQHHFCQEFGAELFKDGAKWAIEQFLKSLWHPVSKEPEENRNILVEHKCGDLHYYTENYDCYYEDPWDFKVRILNITRWCYIDDLLPKEGDTHD